MPRIICALVVRSASFGGSDALSADELLPSSGLDLFFRRYQLAPEGDGRKSLDQGVQIEVGEVEMFED